MTNELDTLLKSIDSDPHTYNDPDTARLTIHQNSVVDSHMVEGLTVIPEELEDGVRVRMIVEDNAVLPKPVHLCFGVIPKTGTQRILMDVTVGVNAKVALVAHCSFPFAEDVKHMMNATITLKEGADYSYFERHVHSEAGGLTVIPVSKVFVGERARFKTEFELLKGRVGSMDINYEAFVKRAGLVEMTARVSGRGSDRIKLTEIARLEEEYARAVLASKIAVRDEASAEIYNTLSALAPYCRGHVDCKEIIKDNGRAIAVPVVDVRSALAHVTHEAAVGSVDKKQLETLMARGLSEDEASELIIQGLLS